MSYTFHWEVTIMKDKTCCFTGHRMIPEWQKAALSTRLRVELRSLILNGYQYFGAGGALGFDTLAAEAVLSLKAEFPHIKLILVLPCKGQANHWSSKAQAVYESIKSRAALLKDGVAFYATPPG